MLDFLGWVFTSFLSIISIINIFLLIFTTYHGFKIRMFHHNFRLLQLQVLVSFFILSIGCSVFVIMIFNAGQTYITTEYFLITQEVMLYGDCLLRPISYAFVVERTFATIKSQDYEKKSYWWLSLFLVVLIQIITIILVMILYYWYVHVYIFISITLVLDVISLALTENIRAMNAVHPLLLTITIFNLISMSYAFISLPTGFLVNYVMLIFYGIMNASIIVCLILMLNKDDVYREKILYRLPLMEKFMNRFHAKKNSTNITNVDGTRIVHVMNDENHFNTLRHAWK